EGGQSNGVDWLIKNHRDWIDAEFVLNHDGGGILAEHGKPLMMLIEPAEKLYADYTLTVTSPGGHSSLPVPDNAIYHLTDGLTRLEHYKFPVELNNVTRAYFERMSKVEKGQRSADMKSVAKEPPDAQAAARLSEDPIYNSILHTTCVATRLNAGHANNALPQSAQANVNCRIEPGHSPEDIRQQLEKIVADSKISISYVAPIGGGAKTQAVVPPPLRDDVMKSLEKITDEMWPGLPVIPDQASGASDGVYTNAAGRNIAACRERRCEQRLYGEIRYSAVACGRNVTSSRSFSPSDVFVHRSRTCRMKALIPTLLQGKSIFATSSPRLKTAM
ncbi:MAG: hypothetical protein DMG95_10405, partial [Acidobacteria bacterium]